MRIVICLIFLFFIGCHPNKTDSNLVSNSYMAQFFNSDEIKELEKIQNFYLQRRCGSKIYEDSCYTRFMLDRRKNPNLDFECLDIEKTRLLFNSLDSTLISKIWYKSRGHRTVSYQPHLLENTVWYNFDINSNYFQYLENIGNSDPSIKFYFEKLKNAEGISPSAEYIFITSAEKFNWSNSEIQIIEAIHQLTLETKFLDFYKNRMHEYKIVKKELN